MTNIDRGSSTKRLVLLAMFSAIIVVLSVVPYLGYIPLGFINATTIHIPVIIGAILLGPKEGGFLGGVFGLTSLLKNTFQPNLTSFVFSPFYSSPDGSGSIWSLIICLVPRILIGVVAGLVFNWIQRKDKTKILACGISAILASLTNTVLVMSGIYLFFGGAYATAKKIEYVGVFKAVSAVVATVGVPEAIVAAILTILICKPLFIALKRK
ncbi:MAG: hypothetical protein K0R90_445 [Oscillospiraceae bacterium]|jgi:uncharacterized membrane protein|nr:hypothetical protein [Oscillospiraceae bacterium]